MLYGLLTQTAGQFPRKPAVICGNHRYNYSQFKRRVDRLATAWQTIGIRPADRVAVIQQNCHRFLESYFAAARLGAILVPINYRLSTAEFCEILKDSGAVMLIYQPSILRSTPICFKKLPLLKWVVSTETPVQSLDGVCSYQYEALLRGMAEIPERLTSGAENDTVHIYYTSGTTGRAKGVMLTQNNHLHHVRGTVAEFGLNSDDRWLHVSPMFHLADAWSVWAITRVGGTHVLIPSFDPLSLMETIEKHRVTLSNFIPTMLNVLVNHPQVSGFDYSSLRLVLSGGAPIAKEVVRRVLDCFNCTYVQTYGLTETSPFLTVSILKESMRDLPFDRKLAVMATTGRPFYDVSLRLIREDGASVKADGREVGEIIAKGRTVTPGYWQREGETSARLREGWLHTGDMAVINGDGYLTIVDRREDKIISGGENIYSIEVEDALYAHPDILEAAVIGLPDPHWGERVVAVVVPTRDGDLDSKSVISFCRQRLAHFKVPKQVIRVGELPKTGSAKVCKYQIRRMLMQSQENKNNSTG